MRKLFRIVGDFIKKTDKLSDEWIVEECNYVLSEPTSHPQAVFFARERLKQAEDRIRQAASKSAQADDEAALQKSLRQRGEQLRSIFDPMTPKGKEQPKVKPKRFCDAMPPFQ